MLGRCTQPQVDSSQQLVQQERLPAQRKQPALVLLL
jgi:hypothetical protein